MVNKDETTSASGYESLLKYFSLSESSTLEPIAHLDEEINEIARESEHTLRRAAVLLPITRHQADYESRLVLTVRSENLNSHAGQISLPGGTQEQQDQDEVATALRETEEEIGLQAHHVEVIGRLGDLPLPSGFHVTPIVGVIESNLSFTPSPVEVADIFQVPLKLVLDMTAYSHSTMTFNNKPRKILELHYEDYRIWGATAAILYHLAREISNTVGDVKASTGER
ncbi:MAG TPA: CoA pyrophosphatase [Gammaproteobacteria bacterium]|nr:CoA pyrophosphatase [Gammaproteobacteria bacterium]